jgi:peptidoglycan hydrolase-like protein with peptidoglycan-binding domain
MQGEDVRQVQEAPIAAGINVSADGVFGKDTDNAVRQFQQQKWLTADGVVGVQTRKELGL